MPNMKELEEPEIEQDMEEYEGMTVAQLIAQLSIFPADTPVHFRYNNGDPNDGEEYDEFSVKFDAIEPKNATVVILENE